MINDEENYQVVQPAYYLIDMGFSGTVYDFNYSMMFNNILNKKLLSICSGVNRKVIMFTTHIH